MTFDPTQVQALTEEWHAALAMKLEADDTDEWPAAYRWEQDAYDRLIDYVEAHELNYTRWDPRGPKEADDWEGHPDQPVSDEDLRGLIEEEDR
jgi:hypothetical protein